MTKKKKKNEVGSPPRASYPEAERKYGWLTPLLDAFAQHEVALHQELAEETARRGTPVACHKGCSACCHRPIVPILRQEIAGLSFYVSEVLPEHVQERLKPRLLRDNSTEDCPFLLDGECSVYPMRPLGCRGLIVYRKPCEPEEAIYETRPSDVFHHSRGLARKVGLRVLDARLDGGAWRNDAAKRAAFERGAIAASAAPMHECDWSMVARTIDIVRAARASKPR